jgi:hypothetical protein
VGRVPKEKAIALMDDATRALLSEINTKKLWFHARKTKPIWVRLLDRPQVVQTLEGAQSVPAGTYLCRGEGDELWPQSAKALRAKYLQTMEFDQTQWRKCVPRPGGADVLAARVPHSFLVQGEWGVFRGEPQDFLLKPYSDRHLEFPAEMWIVKHSLFLLTYERVD